MSVNKSGHDNTANGAPVAQWDCWNGAVQQWALRGSGSGTSQLVTVASGLCLSNEDAGQGLGVAGIKDTASRSTARTRSGSTTTRSRG
ncbi:RICIN domain-containing protein [Actinosynnema pretiosum]|uniref:RICIN domain-containing protein n=1 Tax=Actinosynnema pretiosum TaxID=42197 RepID=UPI001E3DF1D9|nr:RICIN domain-containing protein [Actinosynnema pretiosum]